MLWAKVEPILRAAYALMDENEDTGATSSEPICRALDLPEDDNSVILAIRQLRDSGYLKADFNGAGIAYYIEPTALGLEHCSGWPSPGSGPVFVTEFIEAITARADDASTPDEERGRLRRLAEAAGGVGKDVLTEVASKVIEHQAGI